MRYIEPQEAPYRQTVLNPAFVAVKPFIKWAGGKGQLIKEIQKLYPANLGSNIKKYAEPFVGGGAVLFDVLSKYQLNEIYISDVNKELINTYTAIKNNPQALIELLTEFQNDYLPKNTEERKLYYYEKRERFNFVKIQSPDNILELAALFIFLNKTCFNGLYRVNRKGLFNVPMGAYKNPLICDAANIYNISIKLQNVRIVCGDYRQSLEFIDSNTFVYFDPPYRPITTTSNFTAYTENLFDDKAQQELAEYVELLNKKQAKIVISNSDPKNSDINDDFFDNLYSCHKIYRVEATRMINCNAESRGKINELLISNF